MQSDRSPGAWSGSGFSGWFVDAINGWPEPGLREQPPSLCTEREDDQGLTRLLSYAPSSPFRKEEGRKRHVALEGAEHGVSSELLTGVRVDARPRSIRVG
jgi:hypothetical protein